ncbi:hypothetical protein [Pseudolactococcus raffinolactis]|uniref:hypothetical protein n=1 Tax=Pseudolactococcus raffinolactis TaxID=1366 RepID=UPI0014368A0E|nr:hypothetical protein [Lactococcus raffinolactis]QIW50770.1 hypothetical protein GU337_02180 [Lactococcus raffinolactis]
MTFEEAIELIEDECRVEAEDGFSTKEKDLDTFLALSIIKNLEETYEAENQEVLKLKNKIEISKIFFQNILDVNPNVRIGSPSHLANCVHVMKNSAENALKRLEKGEDD